MKKVNCINVCTEYVFDMHNVNANEDGAPKNVNGRNYVSGQKVRYMLMKTIELESDLETRRNISTSDSVTSNITKDLRSDLIGYMNTEDNSYANKRVSPLQVSFAMAKEQSNFFDDLFVRFKVNPTGDEHNKQRINNKTYSENDVVNFNYKLDCSMLSTSQYFTFDDKKFIDSFFIKHVDETERKKRAILVLKGTSYLTGLANQSRNAVDNTPKKVFICFDDKLTTKKFFEISESEKKDMLDDLNRREIPYFIGGIEGGMGVNEAYDRAVKLLSEIELVDNSKEMLTQEEVKEKYGIQLCFDKVKVATPKKSKSKKDDELVTIHEAAE